MYSAYGTPWRTDDGWGFRLIIIFLYFPIAWCFPLWFQIMLLNFAVIQNVLISGDLLKSEAFVRLSDSDPIAAFGFLFPSHWCSLIAFDKDWKPLTLLKKCDEKY